MREERDAVVGVADSALLTVQRGKFRRQQQHYRMEKDTWGYRGVFGKGEYSNQKRDTAGIMVEKEIQEV